MLPVNKLSVEPVCGEQTGQLMHQNGSGKEIHESHVTSMPEIFIPADPRQHINNLKLSLRVTERIKRADSKCLS